MNNKNNKNNSVEYNEEWDWEKAVPTGRAVERKLAHKKGISHEGVHLWVIRTINKEPEILFQHRAADKDMYPDCLDITVGGHVPFGTHENKVQKEAYEEIGICPSDKDLIDLGYFRYEEKNDNLFHREFQRVYILADNRPLNEYQFTDGEVDGIFAVKLSDLQILLEKDFTFKAQGFEKKGLFFKDVSRKDFHPLLFADSMKEYMDIVMQAAVEIADNKKVTVKMPELI